MDHVTSELAAVEVKDVDGATHRLSEAWATRPAVLVWVRHFGWVACRQQVAELRPHVPEIRAAGGELTIVGSGAPHFAKAFREDLRIPDVALFSDEELRSYQLAGFRRGVGALLSPRALGNYLKAFARGHTQTSRKGDALQQGGAMVIRTDGSVAFRFVGRASGDHPDPAALIAALGRSAA